MIIWSAYIKGYQFLKTFCVLQEDYLGEDQKFTDFDDSGENSQDFEHVLNNLKQKSFDPRYYRPFGVNVNAALHDIQAHLVKVRRFCKMIENWNKFELY